MSEHLGTGKTLDSRYLSRNVYRPRNYMEMADTVLGFAGLGRGWCLKISCVSVSALHLPSFSLGGRWMRRLVGTGACNGRSPQVARSPPRTGARKPRGPHLRRRAGGTTEQPPLREWPFPPTQNSLISGRKNVSLKKLGDVA